jgi:hypothetical protein
MKWVPKKMEQGLGLGLELELELELDLTLFLSMSTKKNDVVKIQVSEYRATS